MRTGWLLLLAFATAGCGGGAPGQATAAGLYEPLPRYEQAAPLDGYVVRTSYASGPREIPVLVRHPRGAPGLLPVVVWSHGGEKKADGRFNNREWGDALVQAGYVVVHLSHLPRSDAEVAALLAEFGLTPEQLTDGPRVFEANVDRARDAIAVLNDLPGIGAAFPALAGRLDLGRVALAGHSRGAYTVRAVACARVDLGLGWREHRFTAPSPVNVPLAVVPRAWLANSPQGPGQFGFFDRGGGDHSWRDCTAPDLAQTGAGDFADETPADRVRPFELMPPGDKHLMFIDSFAAQHDTFNLAGRGRADFEAWVRSTALAFLDAYVRDKPAARAWLASRALERASGGTATLTSR